MKVNIYEYGKKKQWCINDKFEIENYKTEDDISTTRLVKSIECVDMKLEAGDLIDSGHKIERAVIVENGYDVYVRNFRDELINENLKDKHELEGRLKGVEKYKSRVAKTWFLAQRISRPKTLKEALEMIEDGYCIYDYGIAPTMEPVVIGKDKFTEMYTENGGHEGLRGTIALFGLLNTLKKKGEITTCYRINAEFVKKFYDSDSYIIGKGYYGYDLIVGTNPEDEIEVKEEPKKVSFWNKIFGK